MRVILAIHGYTGRPLQEIEKWRDAAASLGAIVIAPAGTQTSGKPGLGWNAIHCCGDPMRDGVDDLGFVVHGAVGAFLIALDGKYGGGGGGINANGGVGKGGGAAYVGGNAHVIATGFSNGGFLSSLLGLMPGATRPSWLVGVVPTGGYQYGVGLYGGPPSGPGPLPAMSHHGGRDAVVDPGGCCASYAADGGSNGSNCRHGIGIGQETCTSVKLAFEMWSGINGCSDTVLDDEAVVNDVRPLENARVHRDDPRRIFTCWRGEGCIEPTNFCLWNNEGHSWGNHFPGMHMTREWMEGVFRRAESRTTDVAGHGHGGKRTGRITLSSAFAFSTVVLLCATVGAPRILRMLHCFVGKGRKWKR